MKYWDDKSRTPVNKRRLNGVVLSSCEEVEMDYSSITPRSEGKVMIFQNYTEENYPVVFIELATQTAASYKCPQINAV